MSIGRVLVANRGEIAVRVFRTCTRLGIETVAVATPDDRGALHARSADDVRELGSYLDAGAIVAAALAAKADAVHPGYGFLAESPVLADAVVGAGLIWVGPSAETLRLGGDKLSAKAIADRTGVPTLPAGPPERVGLPLVVKAAAGGGGRGMRIVRSLDQLEPALAEASREAEASFGDGTVFCERYLERPRHVEAQLMGDEDAVVVLGLRDCSVQRRHQKVIEEAPPPALAPAARDTIERAAIAFATAIGYVSAGTAEFLVDGPDAFFLELNGRIQVEHPVTEALTGLDIVELQLRVAAGERLELGRVTETGHAVEARLYAEDPQTFLPRAGRIERLRLPTSIRVDAGVSEGDEIGTRYDPMIAKLVAHGSSRDKALDRLRSALLETSIEGVTTNLPFLRWLVDHPAFRSGDASTAFLVDHPALGRPPRRTPDPVWAHAWRLNLAAPAPAPPPELDPRATRRAGEPGELRITAPMPGTVIAVEVEAGDVVEERGRLVVLEAMKMEQPIAAPLAARVRAVHVAKGDSVAADQLLVELEPAGSAE